GPVCEGHPAARTAITARGHVTFDARIPQQVLPFWGQLSNNRRSGSGRLIAMDSPALDLLWLRTNGNPVFPIRSHYAPASHRPLLRTRALSACAYWVCHAGEHR